MRSGPKREGERTALSFTTFFLQHATRFPQKVFWGLRKYSGGNKSRKLKLLNLPFNSAALNRLLKHFKSGDIKYQNRY